MKKPRVSEADFVALILTACYGKRMDTNEKEWRSNEDALVQYFTIAPTIFIRKLENRCPECKSADYDPIRGCLTAHGKFPIAA
jgi:hypothetical protein